MIDVLGIPTVGDAEGVSSSGAMIPPPQPTSMLLTVLSTSLTGTRDVPVLHLVGELDIAGRSTVLAMCTSAVHRELVVDLTDLTFMDCAGYGSLVSARLVLDVRGGSLTLAGVNGQPLRLLSLIAGAEPAAEASP